jgi:hypothetical protein
VTADAITIVRSRGPILAKRIAGDGRIFDYDQVKTVDLFTVRLGGLAGLEELLRRLQRRLDCAVVRGAIADPARISGVRRLLYDDPETGAERTLRETPRAWVALDVDKLACPPDCDLYDLQEGAKAAVTALPAAFRGASLIVQATASHGIAAGLRLRLWFWLSRPIAGRELKVWLRGSPVDASVFRPAQLIYTAAPRFLGRVADPLPSRIAVLFGPAEMVAVPPAEKLTPPPRRPRPLPDPVHASGYALTELTRLATRVLTASRGTRHATIVLAARRFAELEAAGLAGSDDIEKLLIEAATSAGLKDDGRDPETEVHAALAWARAHLGEDRDVGSGR